MRDVSKLKFIGSSFCSQYQSQARFYIDEAHASGMRHLVFIYENGEPDFLAGIPDAWADENVQDFVFWPMKNPNSPYPAWEVPARVYGNPMLFAWWKSRPSGSASRLCADLEKPVDRRSVSHTLCQGGVTSGLPRVLQGPALQAGSRTPAVKSLMTPIP